MDTVLNSVYTEAIMDVISALAGIELKESNDLLDLHISKSSETIHYVMGLMFLKGQHHAVLGITASFHTMRILCSYMLGVSLVKVSYDDVQDAICELVNMTAGSVKTRLRDTEYEALLTTPFAITGVDLNLYIKERVAQIESILLDEETDIRLHLQVIYE